MKYYLENIPSVLIREAGNKHHIYLYPRCNGKVWAAYEQSAYNLHLLMPRIKIFYQKIEGVPKPFATLVVPQLSLDFLIDRGVDMSDCDGGRNLKLTLSESYKKRDKNDKTILP